MQRLFNFLRELEWTAVIAVALWVAATVLVVFAITSGPALVLIPLAVCGFTGSLISSILSLRG